MKYIAVILIVFLALIIATKLVERHNQDEFKNKF